MGCVKGDWLAGALIVLSMIASAETLGSKLNRLIDLGLSSQQTEAKTNPNPNLNRARAHTHGPNAHA